MRQLKKKEIKKATKIYKRDTEIILLMENIQYARNVATMFRVADAAGVRRIILTGISKLPPFGKDLKKVSRNKENAVEWISKESASRAIPELKAKGFEIIAIELTDTSMELKDLPNHIKNKKKICFIAGNEVYGVINKTLEKCDAAVQIPMYGKGASLNVASSVAIVLFSI